jgi:UDP-glucose 4-epimerase
LENLNQKAGCLVTGVAGFVGSHLAERLLAENFFVVGVDNFFSGHRENLASLLPHPDFAFHEHSITERGLLQGLKAQYPGLDHCFQLAAVVSVPYSVEHPEATMEVNYRAAVRLLHDAEELGFRAFAFAGSAAEYGDDQRLPLLEEYATEDTEHLSPYGRAKYLASREVAASPCGVALRCFNIYGPRQDPGSPYSGVISRFVTMALARQPLTIFGDGRQSRDFIYVGDVVEAYLCAARLCRQGRGGERRLYNIGTGAGTSILKLAETLNELVGNREELTFRPERPGDIRISLASVEAFRTATGWEPRVCLREGLKRTCEWAGGVENQSSAVCGKVQGVSKDTE